MDEIKVRHRILEKFMALSKDLGFKHVTMDMLASACGISKKTIYRFFDGKNQIVAEVADGIQLALRQQIKQAIGSSDNPIEQFDRMHELSVQIISSITPIQVHDVQKYYPEFAGMMSSVRRDLDDYFLEKYKEGIKKGLFKDIDPIFIQAFFQGAGDRVFDMAFINENKIPLTSALKWFDSLYKTGLMKN